MKKGTKLYSIFKNKCPRCQEGDFFVSKNPYNLTKMSKMPEECPVCGQSYQPEQGFYFGAMYVSYAIGVAIFVTLWVATNVLFPSINVFAQIGIVLFGIFGLFPVNFRLSRKIWINLFIKYQEPINQNTK